MPNMSSFVLYHFGDKLIAIPFRKTRCWEDLDRSEVVHGVGELPEGCEPCWKTYCQVSLDSCELRKAKPRLTDVDVSGYLVPDPEEEDGKADDFPSFFPGAEGRLIKGVTFPLESDMPEVCALHPLKISGPVEYLVIINSSGLTWCRDVAVRWGLSCGACKAAA